MKLEIYNKQLESRTRAGLRDECHERHKRTLFEKAFYIALSLSVFLSFIVLTLHTRLTVI